MGLIKKPYQQRPSEHLLQGLPPSQTQGSVLLERLPSFALPQQFLRLSCYSHHLTHLMPNVHLCLKFQHQ